MSIFFRRSLCQHKQYFCKKGKRCMTRGLLQKNNICKYCRFQKCVQVGMRLTTTHTCSKSRLELIRAADSPLQRLILCRKATFVNRMRELAKVFGGQQNIPPMANSLVETRTMSLAVVAERDVLRQYFRDSGLLEVNLPQICLDKLVANVFNTWVIYENFLFTVRNCGHLTDTVYFLNESYLPVNEESTAEFYRGNPSITNVAVAARHGMDYSAEFLRVACKFHKARLDEAEQAVFAQLFSLYTAVEVTRSPKTFAQALSTLFRLLQGHYTKNYDDVALKIGQMILLLQELTQIKRLLDEHLILLRLAGRQPIIAEPTDYVKEEVPDTP
ncbi:hypothetical protein AAVH_15578 [Aphelenchoides avenae]|nr:hypothetical protein AAVH_15578 [Aphelenchus avenae]